MKVTITELKKIIQQMIKETIQERFRSEGEKPHGKLRQAEKDEEEAEKEMKSAKQKTSPFSKKDPSASED